MAEEVAKGAGGLPEAIRGSDLVLLPASRKTVEVRRWSYKRAIMVSKYLNEVLSQLPEDVIEKSNDALQIFYEHGADRIFEVAKLSLAPEHRDVLDDETDAADVFAVIKAAFALNEAGDLLKKSMGLAGQFLLAKAVSSPKTPEPPKETAPTPQLQETKK